MENAKTLFMVMSVKGGVGKSMVAKVIYQNYIDQYGKDNVVLVDADHKVKALSESYSEAVEMDISDEDGRPALANMSASGKNVIVDFAGGSVDEIQSLFGGEKDIDPFLRAYTKNGYKIKIVIPVMNSVTSCLALKALHNIFKDQVSYFIVQNIYGQPDASKYEKFFQIFNGTVISRENHKILKDFIPAQFAAQSMGVDLQKDTVILPMLPHQLAAWVTDTSRFEQFSPSMGDVLIDAAETYFRKLADAISKTSLFDNVK